MKIQLHKPHNGVSPRALGAFHIIPCWQSMGLAFAKSELSEFSTKLQTRLIISPKMASRGGGWTHWLESAATEKPVHRRGEGVAVIRLITATRGFRRSTGRRSTRGTGDSSHGYFLLKHMMIITGVCFKKLSPLSLFGVSRFRRRGPTYLQLTVLSWRSDA